MGYFDPPGKGSKSSGPPSLSQLSRPAEKPEPKRGFGGTGVGLGVGRLFGLLGQGVTGLGNLAHSGLRQGVGVNFSDGLLHGLGSLFVGDKEAQREHKAEDQKLLTSVAKSIPASLAGTALTPAHGLQGVAEALSLGKAPDVVGGIESRIGRALGGEEFRPQTFFERVRSQGGILPAAATTIGDVAIGGSAVKGALKAGSAGAARTGAAGTAAKLAAKAESPLLEAATHPYQTSARKIREGVTKPAQTKVLAASGVENTPGALGPPTPPELVKPGPPVSGTTRRLGWVENRLEALDAQKTVREQERLANVERNITSRSAPVRAAVDAAAEHLMPYRRQYGFGRKDASNMIGDEIIARLEGTRLAQDELGPVLAEAGIDVPDLLVRSGIRNTTIPDELLTPELSKAIDEAVDLYKTQKAETRATLLGSRKGEEGLTGLGAEDAVDPALTGAQSRKAAEARRLMKRAASESLANQIARETGWAEGRWNKSADRLARVIDEENALAEARGAAEEAVTTAGDLPPARRTALTGRLAKSIGGLAARLDRIDEEAGRLVEARNEALARVSEERALLGAETDLPTGPVPEGVLPAAGMAPPAQGQTLGQQLGAPPPGMTGTAAQGYRAGRRLTKSEGRIAGINDRLDALAEDRASVAETMTDLETGLDDLESFATPTDLRGSGRRVEQAKARVEKIVARERLLAKTGAEVEKAMSDIRATLDEGALPAQLRKAGLVEEAERLQSQIDQGTARPSLKNTPAKWQPMWHALLEMEKAAKDNPALAETLTEVAANLPDIIELARSKGFDPTHVRHFSPDQVRRLMFGSMRLGLHSREGLLHEVSATTRKPRLFKTGDNVERSLEALNAAVVEVTSEVRTNNVIDWVESSVARAIPEGAKIPDDWELWDDTRTHLLTGEDGAGGLVAKQSGQIIPKSVGRVLRNHSKDYSHWAPQMLAKATDPWRMFVLTLSPGWYVRNLVGNVILAANSGVRMTDWVSAWKEFRDRDDQRLADLPEGTGLESLFRGTGIESEVSRAGGGTLIPRAQGLRAGVREAAAEGQGQTLGRTRGVIREVQRRMMRANEVVDEFARAAVYKQGRRLNLSHEEAIHKASTAIVDYQALSSAEQTWARAAIPFYTWQKGILKVVSQTAIDHPARAGLLLQLGKMQEQYVADRLGLDVEDVSENYKHLLGSVNVKSFNPFADSGSLTSAQGIAGSLNPFLEIAVRDGLGAPEFFPESYNLSPFGTAIPNVDAENELLGLAASVPGARVLGIRRPGQDGDIAPAGERVGSFIGIPKTVDDAEIRSRLLKARRQIRGTVNPETKTTKTANPFLPARAR